MTPIDIEGIRKQAEAEVEAEKAKMLTDTLLKMLKGQVSVQMKLEDFAAILKAEPIKKHLAEWTLADLLPAPKATVTTTPRSHGGRGTPRLRGDAKQTQINTVRLAIQHALEGSGEMSAAAIKAKAITEVNEDTFKRRWIAAAKAMKVDGMMDQKEVPPGGPRNTVYFLVVGKGAKKKEG